MTCKKLSRQTCKTKTNDRFIELIIFLSCLMKSCNQITKQKKSKTVYPNLDLECNIYIYLTINETFALINEQICSNHS